MSTKITILERKQTEIYYIDTVREKDKKKRRKKNGEIQYKGIHAGNLWCILTWLEIILSNWVSLSFENSTI